MPPLTIVSSDRPAKLIERLAHDLGREPLGPFANETIVVQSRGTERWVRHELARRHGCAANLSFPFAASFFHTLARSLSPDYSTTAQELSTATTRKSDNPFDRDSLTWSILTLLENRLSDEPGFEPLRAFVGTPGDQDIRKLLGLARTLAGRFEEYQLYRPDRLVDWESAELENATLVSPERWQASLWRKLHDTQAPTHHLALVQAEAIGMIAASEMPPPGLPTRLSVFGVSTLPPIFVGMLHAVARHIPVRLYLQAPPRHTWSIGLPTSSKPTGDGRTATEASNPLFAAFGTVVREMVVLLERFAPPDSPNAWEEHHHVASADDTSIVRRGILAGVQSDIRGGVSRGREAGLEPPLELDATRRDASLEVHRCHSPMREMEVLRDQLLAAFAGDPTLRPHDVLLLLPDVSTYAPFVESVFAVREEGIPYIPHRIADRPVAQESHLADAALRLLRLVGARWTAAEIVELIDLPPVKRAAGLPDGGNSDILRWIAETNIRWGRDGAMRNEVFGLPAVEANSWRAGMDRLVMGYATGRSTGLVADIFPQAGHTIGDPASLGVFVQFIDRLFDTLTDWRTPRTLGEWSIALRASFTEFLCADDEIEARELDVIMIAVDGLASMDADAGSSRTYELSVVRDWLEQKLDDDSMSSGFLTGGMTVCALKPMRVVPHRVIVIAGLDDATFPRRHPRPAFDLLATSVRDGDRSRRADDRQLFLDTLLAAEERLILSYVARSAKTNVERAASVVVAELLDVVDRSFVHPGSTPAKPRRAREIVEVEHRLQPFSASYFTDRERDHPIAPRLFSYSRVNARALATRWSSGKEHATPFVTGAIAVASDHSTGTGEIRLEDLIRCWTNPSRFFCERSLGLRLPGEDKPLDECEPMSMDGLDEYLVHDDMLRRHLAGGRSIEQEREEAVARGHLPPGMLARVWFDRLNDDLSTLLAAVGSPRFEDPASISVVDEAWTIVGRADGITGDGRLQVRPAICKPKDKIRAWITHLALTASHGTVRTDLVANDCHLSLAPVTDPRPLLDFLVKGYHAALREPIPFFERASHAYVEQWLKFERDKLTGKPSKLTRSPLACARDGYEGSDFGDFNRGDSDDHYVTLCWRGRQPLEECLATFEEYSLAFWRPVFAALQGTETPE